MGEFIIIGRAAGRVAQLVDEETLAFGSVREFDLWRHGLDGDSRQATIEVDVMAALRELGSPRNDLLDEVAAVIGELCDHVGVPATVKDVVPEGKTYRTLLRRWKEQIEEDPKEFLERVRLLHARRLIEQQGLSRKEAAFRAGYGSTARLQQSILRRAARNAGVESI